MRTNVKRTLSLLLALVLLSGMLTAPAGAATAEAEAAAQALYQLGLFTGAGTRADGSPDFKLDNTATRAEAAAILTRLLGADQEARSSHYSHPFTDAGWASDYIGYIYHQKLVDGVSDTFFGASWRIDDKQFLTLVLRILGYTDVDYRNPYSTAGAAGLRYTGRSDFRRGDMAIICNSALSCKLFGTNQTLLQRLEAQGAVKNGTAAGFTPGPVPNGVTGSFAVTSAAEAQTRLLAAMSGRTTPIVLTGPVSIMSACSDAALGCIKLCSDITGVSVSTSYNSAAMTMTVYPLYTDAVEIMAYLEGKRASLSPENLQTLAKAQQVHSTLAKPGMSEYDRVKAFHDYLVNNTTYGGSSDRRFTAGGALVDGYAVCDGYAMAFDLLCYLSGIECIRVTGWANEAHAWNKVKVNGSWYNIDVTWDDPASSRPNLIYDYFLISDAAIARDHVQDANPYWPAAPVNWPGR